MAHPAIFRMKKRRDFLAAAKGHKVVTTTLVLQARPLDKTLLQARPLNETDAAMPVRVGFTVTKKAGNAVTRNRIRRRLRAAADQLMSENAQPGWDYVLIGRAKTKEEPFDTILRDLRYAIRKTVKLEAAQNSAESG